MAVTSILPLTQPGPLPSQPPPSPGRVSGAIVVAVLSGVAVPEWPQFAEGLRTGPSVQAPAFTEPWRDATPVDVEMTVEWRKVRIGVRADELRYPGVLWRHLHFDDWDAVPPEIRRDALTRMVTRYQDVIASPAVWDHMTASEWDAVPQPIRSAAFIEMLRYWSGHYGVGSAFHLPRRLVAETLSAVVMVESWFDHRAVSQSRSGNRDLGLAQASTGTRAALGRLFDAGVIDFAPSTDADYFDPWQATRVAALWFELMLDETNGELDTAVRAYHVGSAGARRGAGSAYLQNVRDKRARYIRHRSDSASWQFLFSRVREGEENVPTPPSKGGISAGPRPGSACWP